MKVLVVMGEHRDLVGVCENIDDAVEIARMDFQSVAEENDMDAFNCPVLIDQDEKRFFCGKLQRCYIISFPHPTEDIDIAWYAVCLCEVKERK